MKNTINKKEKKNLERKKKGELCAWERVEKGEKGLDWYVEVGSRAILVFSNFRCCYDLDAFMELLSNKMTHETSKHHSPYNKIIFL